MLNTFKEIMRLVRWSNLLFLAALIYLMEKWVAVPILDAAAFGEQLPWFITLLLALATVLIAAGGYVINDYFDVKIDRINRPDELIVTRTIPKPTAMHLSLCLSGVGILCGLGIAILLRSMTLGILFILGLIAASYSAAGSALTAMTTSFTVDILQADKKKDDAHLTSTRKKVHVAMSVLMIVTIIVFNALNNDSAINAVYSLASYTYGPILGMCVFGMACKKPVNDRLVPVICIAAPLISLVLQKNSEAWFNGYQIGFELLLINAALTVAGLAFLIKKNK